MKLGGPHPCSLNGDSAHTAIHSSVQKNQSDGEHSEKTMSHQRNPPNLVCIHECKFYDRVDLGSIKVIDILH